MAYVAQDGKAFGNHEMGKHYDKTRPKPKAEPKGERMEAPEQQDIQESVQQHGPVTHMEMHSHHKDGTVHKATHHDAASAHAHISHAFGENPEQSTGMHGRPSMGMGGQSEMIPGMA